MACDISKGRAEVCKDSIGGLRNIYFVNFDPTITYTFDAINTDAIEAVSGTPTLHKYELKSDDSTFIQTTNSDRNAGTSFESQELAITLKKLTVESHREIKLLIFGRTNVVIEDNNSNFFLMGIDFGAEVTGGTTVTGGAKGDLSGYTLTLVAEEKTKANFFEATTEAGLLSAGYGSVVTG